MQGRLKSAKRNIKSYLVPLLEILLVFVLVIVLGRMYNDYLKREEENRFYSLIGKPLQVMLARIKDDHGCKIIFHRVGSGWKSESIAYFQDNTRISKKVNIKANIEAVIESHASASGIYVLEKDSFTVTMDWYKTVVLVFVDEENIITSIVFVRRA